MSSELTPNPAGLTAILVQTGDPEAVEVSEHHILGFTVADDETRPVLHGITSPPGLHAVVYVRDPQRGRIDTTIGEPVAWDVETLIARELPAAARVDVLALLDADEQRRVAAALRARLTEGEVDNLQRAGVLP